MDHFLSNSSVHSCFDFWTARSISAEDIGAVAVLAATLPASSLASLAASLNRMARSILAVNRSSKVSICLASSNEVGDEVGDVGKVGTF